jgi:hypothetical protein
MNLYNVHLYRTVRLLFAGIEADTLKAAAAIARIGLTSNADEIDDGYADDVFAQIDVAGDNPPKHFVTIDFEPERLRKAAPGLLEAIPSLIGLVHRLLPKQAQSDSTLDNLAEVIQARAALARATESRTNRRQP